MSKGTSPPPPPSNQLILSKVFSPENKIRAIDSIRSKSIGLRFMPKAYLRRAAVLIPLCWNLQGQPCFLFTLRSLSLSKHKGEICFPGGAADPEDNGNDVTTALRETEEELGISSESIEIWTVMNPMPTASSLMGVTPVIGLIKTPLDPSTLKVNPSEVETAFTIPFEHFCNPINWGHTQKTAKGWSMPVYKNMKVYHPGGTYFKPAGLSESSSEGESDHHEHSGAGADGANNVPAVQRDVRLWGLTAILTHVCLEALIPTIYKRHVPLLKSSSSSDGPSKL